MKSDPAFDLSHFLPYMLNQAAEAASLGFQQVYKQRYGMLRTEWRVLFHLGRHGEMTAKAICERARIHKTKISRAVKALEDRRFLIRHEQQSDRRVELLSLTRAGAAAYADLSAIARDYDQQLAAQFSETERAILRQCLQQLADLPARARE
ncbi:MarR family transcriptional regulator [Devosia limi DSM 17137]|uniref:DNA-binding transcriptional regulator, MarR family n=1 Tax=Devosia limi DSM 17137 TaxID=1121477 RepID=A0A0F5LW20_9HYPH|nr:MarR family transcriptional regulator [Devosia limi]KKB86491.1 MarR family transcriptional regulator [Devosia limi DSM 17137]SHE86795.1 DNA-binding transcriptional regulator, MarR family [Devosia limi DSM 17137]